MTDWADLDIPDTDFDVGALAAAIDAERIVRGLTWQAVANEVNRRSERPLSPHPISASTIRGLADKPWGVEGDGVLQMLIWLGRTPESFVPGHPGGDLPEARLPVIDPPGLLRFDVPGIHAALDLERADRELTWADVAREVAGLATPATLRAMAKQTRTGFPQVMRIARWLKRPCASLTHVTRW